jgi:hypothetical protein
MERCLTFGRLRFAGIKEKLMESAGKNSET